MNRRPSSRVTIILSAACVSWLCLILLLGSISNVFISKLCHLSLHSRAGMALSTLTYQVPKLLLILSLVIFCVGIIRSYVRPERVRHVLAGRSEFTGSVLASLLGIVMPFCSCSAIPLFIGFVEAGVPLGVTFSFLLAAPMINEVAIVMLLNLFNPLITILYVGTGLVISVSAGIMISMLKLEKYVEQWVYGVRITTTDQPESQMSWDDRIVFGYEAMKDTIRRVWIFVFVGMGIGTLINSFIPESYLSSLMGMRHWWNVPLAVLVGVPIYSSSAGVIPIVQALMEKGAATGTVLAFMMSVIGLSLPEIIILRKVLKWPLIAVFVSVVASGIIFVGYILNAVI